MSRNFKVNSVQSNKSSTYASPTPFCKVCKDAGKSDFNHWVKDRSGATICPTLLSLECRFCFGSGHTVKYCPTLKERGQTPHQYNTKPVAPEQKPSTQFSSKNAYSELEDDEDNDKQTKNKKQQGNQASNITTTNFSVINIAGKDYRAQKSEPIKKQEQKQKSVNEFPSLVAPVQAPRPTSGPTAKTWASIARAPPIEELKPKLLKPVTEEDPKYELGVFVWTYITNQTQYAKYADKISGMILEYCNLDELFELVQVEQNLINLIKES